MCIEGFYYIKFRTYYWHVDIRLHTILKMEIFPVFSILNCFSDLKMEILPVFSILDKKIWETMNHFPDFIFFIYTSSLSKLSVGVFLCMQSTTSCTLPTKTSSLL